MNLRHNVQTSLVPTCLLYPPSHDSKSHYVATFLLKLLLLVSVILQMNLQTRKVCNVLNKIAVLLNIFISKVNRINYILLRLRPSRSFIILYT